MSARVREYARAYRDPELYTEEELRAELATLKQERTTYTSQADGGASYAKDLGEIADRIAAIGQALRSRMGTGRSRIIESDYSGLAG